MRRAIRRLRMERFKLKPNLLIKCYRSRPGVSGGVKAALFGIRQKKAARTFFCPCREASDATYKLAASGEFCVADLAQTFFSI
jgi:hypothetical protein